jgi:pimeloyl-ACP methyl ester carboxylesterase
MWRRTDQVITDLMRKSWVKKDSLILIGHSQGAKVAAVLAAENKHVAAVALLGFNAFGRYDEYVRRERKTLSSGKHTGAEYQARLDSLYQRWKDINASPNDVTSGNLAWTTFLYRLRPVLAPDRCPDLHRLRHQDHIAENCDLLPLAFISYGKSNYTLKPYVGLDHNFFELRNGVPDHKNGAHWGDVVGDVLQWSGGLPRN